MAVPPAPGDGEGGEPGPSDPDDAPDPYDLDAGTREHYADAALYDFEYRRRRADVNHYRALARRFVGGGAGGGGIGIVEIGCGTGRLLAPLARDGHEVVGIDRSAPMLAEARARLERLPRRARGRARLLRADMRSLPLGPGFHAPLVIAAFNTLQHLYGREDAAACLAGVRGLLSPTGRFAFDVLNPDLKWLTRRADRRWARTRFKHPVTEEQLEYTTNQTYEPISQIAHVRIYYERLDSPDGDRHLRVVRLAHRQFFPAELAALLWEHGFAIETRWGGFSGEPFEGDSESQVFLCTRR